MPSKMQVQRQFEDRGEDTQQRRVQELLGHGRRLRRPERVGAEPPRDGVLQPLRGRSREAVARDSGGCRSVCDGFVDFDSLPDDAQASSWQCGRLRKDLVSVSNIHLFDIATLVMCILFVL